MEKIYTRHNDIEIYRKIKTIMIFEDFITTGKSRKTYDNSLVLHFVLCELRKLVTLTTIVKP